jgi:hypothetical protein
MTTSALRLVPSTSSVHQGPRHCPAAEYAAFIAKLPVSEERHCKHANYHQRFIRTYPDLPK